MSAAQAAVGKQLLSMEQHTFFVTAQALCKLRGFKQSPRLLTKFYPYFPLEIGDRPPLKITFFY
jgi:hypothetical protein